MQRDEVALPKHGVEVVALYDPGGLHLTRRDARIVAQDPGAKTGAGHARHGAPDAAHAHQPDGLFRHVEAEPWALRPQPARALHGAVEGHELFGQRDHQAEGALGDGLLGIFGDVDHRDAPFTSGGDVDGIDADAVFDDAFQPTCRSDDG